MVQIINVIGIDLAKSVFHLCGQDPVGRIVLKRKLSRNELMRFIANFPKCLIGIEACGGANFWVREFKKHGHEVKMIPPQYVKPFVKTNKNDFNDAEAICEAVQRPSMHFVPEKTIEQQDIQMVHRVRARLVRARTALCNEMRGCMAEYGLVTPKGMAGLVAKVRDVLSADNESLSVRGKSIIAGLNSEWRILDERISELDEEINGIFKENESCKRIAKIPGVGKITATALVASIGNPSVFKSGRQMAAWLGLVPRQKSSGGKTVLLGISKRGDTYCRSLLVHGGRSVVQYAERKTDSYSQWVAKKAATRGKNKAAVAVANKNSRIIWKMLMTKEEYREAI